MPVPGRSRVVAEACFAASRRGGAGFHRVAAMESSLAGWFGS